MADKSQFEPIDLGQVEVLTKGPGSGFSEDSGFKTEGGTLDQQPYSELPALRSA